MLKSHENEIKHAYVVEAFLEGQEGLSQQHLSRWICDPYLFTSNVTDRRIEFNLAGVDPKFFICVMLQQAFEQGKKTGRREKTDEINNVLKYDEE